MIIVIADYTSRYSIYTDSLVFISHFQAPKTSIQTPPMNRSAIPAPSIAHHLSLKISHSIGTLLSTKWVSLMAKRLIAVSVIWNQARTIVGIQVPLRRLLHFLQDSA